MNKKISVIVPAYNVEKYLRRCLDSLVHQTYPNMEIIVINDGSTDGTKEIVEEFACRYEGKVFAYNQKNAGQAAARNNGISYATGDYIGFVDSDDFVSPRMYEYLIREAEEKDCDLVTCGYYGCDDETGEIQVYQAGRKGEFDRSIFENPEILRLNAPYPWNKLYRKELLEQADFAFPEGIIFEDLAAVYPLFLSAKKVGRVHEKLYYYIKGRKGGTMSTFDQRHMQILDALKIVDEKFTEKDAFEKFKEILLFFHIRHIQARFDEMEKKKDFSFEEEFRERAEKLLDTYFPGWKETKLYKDKELSVQEAEEGEIEGKSVDEQEKTGKSTAKKIRKAELFDRLIQEKPIRKGQILIESYHGIDCIETGYFIAKALGKSGNYKIYVAAADAVKKEQFTQKLGDGITVVEISDPVYVEILATAEVVMNNQSFPKYYRKRKGQKFVFMDFLPVCFGQGCFASYPVKNMQGIQFSLAQADVILFPEEEKEIFGKCLDEYNMRQVCEKKGYFVPVSKLPFPVVHCGTKEEFVTAYLPSPKNFPGLKDSKNFLFLSELKKQLLFLDANLRDNEVLLVQYPRTVRRYLVEEGWQHIRFAESECEEGVDSSQILAGCDAAVGEAESALFMMEAFGKPVCRYSLQDCERDWTLGKAEDWKENRWEKRDSLEGILAWIHTQSEQAVSRTENEPDPAEWDRYLEKFAKKIPRRKSGSVRRNWVYVPQIHNFQEFQNWLLRVSGTEKDCIFAVDREKMCDGFADWIREYCPDMSYVIILRSFVLSEKEEKKIGWKLTTKAKLREARDRERYLGR